MRRWFHKYLPSKQQIDANSQSKHSLFSLRILKLQCDTVAKGVAVGIFVAFLPIPLQTVLAIILSTIVKGNIVLAVAFTWISNPFTFAPIVYFIYKIGNLVLGTNENTQTIPELHIQFDSLRGFFSSSYEWLAHFSKAYFVGLPVTAIFFALLGYISVIVIWKTSAFFRSKKT